MGNRPRASRALGAVALATTLALATPAAGAVPASRLVYTRGEGAQECPDESALRNAVASRIGYDPFLPGAAVTIRADVGGASGRLRGRVTLTNAQGEQRGARELDVASGDCGELIAALALAISITLDALASSPADAAPAEAPVAAKESSSAAGVDERASSGAVDQPPPAPPLPAPARPSTSPPLEAVGALGGQGLVGSAPGVAFGLRAMGGVRRGWAALGIEGQYDFPGPGLDVSVDLVALALVPCVRWRRAFFACAVGTYGVLGAEGRGLSVTRATTAPYLAVGGRLGFESPLSARFGLLGDLEVRAPLTRTRLEIDGQTAWELPVLSAKMGISAYVRFF